MIRQQGAAPRVGFAIHDLAQCRVSLAGSCELSLCAMKATAGGGGGGARGAPPAGRGYQAS